MPDYTFVDRPDTIVDDLGRFERLAIDTEFMREKTFFAELCLVQATGGDEIYCIDPLNRSDNQRFWPTVLGIPWVAHSARQDIEVIYQGTDIMPVSLFDTQVAAGLLGHAAQIGYANLVKTLFDVELPKAHTRADWSRRPLSKAVLEYAAEDVLYLLPAADLLAEALDKAGRLDWAREDSAQLLDTSLYDIDPTLAVSRLKAARNLRGQRRSAAVHLAAWREQEALRSNRPRQWILKDAPLIDLAFKAPTTIDQLADIDGMPAGLVRRAGEDILSTLRMSEDDGNDYLPPQPPDEAQKALLKAMQKTVSARADELGLQPEVLASKRDLSALLFDRDAAGRLTAGWRYDVVGAELANML